MEFKDYVAIILIAVLGLGSHFGTYKLGRYLERKELTHYFIPALQATYDDGASQGLKDGFKQGKKVGLDTCSDVLGKIDEESRR